MSDTAFHSSSLSLTESKPRYEARWQARWRVYVVIGWQLYHMVGYLGTRDCDIVQRRAAQGLTKLLAEIKQLLFELFYCLQEDQDARN